MNEKKIKQEIIKTCLQMIDLGINQGTSGNISHRYKDGLFITPSAIPYHEIQLDDIVFVPLADRTNYDKDQVPSSELPFHHAILSNRNDVNVVVHNHSIYATAIAICNKPIPACHYMVAAIGGNQIPCAPYATYGTEELSNNIIQTIQGLNGCLLQNHGVIAVGTSLKKALWLANEIEVIAKQYILALQVGSPNILPDQEIQNVINKFQGYGLREDV